MLSRIRRMTATGNRDLASVKFAMNVYLEHNCRKIPLLKYSSVLPTICKCCYNCNISEELRPIQMVFVILHGIKEQYEFTLIISTY